MTDEELRVRAIQELEFYKKDDTFMLADITVDLAIEALEQMPVTTTAGEGGVIYYPQVEGVTPTVIDAGKQERDAIDRKLVCAFIAGLISDDGERKKGLEYIRNMPPVNPTKTGWIPVSERLPEKNMACLVAVGKFNLTQMAMYSDLMGTIGHRIFYQGDVGYGSFEDITEYVKAWMPLPKPYEPQERSGEE